MKLASFPMKALAASLMLVSMTGLAFAKNYKGENYKGEAMPAPCPAPKMLLDGVYLGAQVGYDSYRVREGITPPDPSSLVANPVINATGWVGGLMLGYGKYINDWFYLAGEIFGNVSSAQQKWSAATAFQSATDKFTVNGSWGVALLPGVRLNDTSLGYVRLGWNWANLKSQGSFNVPGVGGGSGSKTNTSNGFNFGVGIETLLWDNWSLRGEFSHTYYNSFNTTVATINPSDNQFMLGLLFHFA